MMPSRTSEVANWAWVEATQMSQTAARSMPQVRGAPISVLDRSWSCSHPEDAELRRRDRCVQSRGEGEAKHPAGLGRINDAVIPHPRSRIIRVALRLVLRADRRLEFLFFLRAPFAALERHAVAPDGRQYAGRLLSSHDADARIGPHPEKARRIGPAAHAVIAGPEAATDQHGDLRDL